VDDHYKNIAVAALTKSAILTTFEIDLRTSKVIATKALPLFHASSGDINTKTSQS
jgi:hypothetical protein